MFDIDTMTSVAELQNVTCVEYAIASNVKRRAEMAAIGCTFFSLLPESAEHFVLYGYENALELVRGNLIQSISDCHKDEYGFRPRYSYSEMSLEELEACLEAI
tara:strand:+ start:395 stop:703 length:309 start_codon:yes stop_codon:yes gene_type:complete